MMYLVDKEIQEMEDIITSDRPFIQFKVIRTITKKFNIGQRHFNYNPKHQIIVDQIETCKQMAMNGIGYAILPSITLNGKTSIKFL